MVFSSLSFLFVFLPALILVYFTLGRLGMGARNWILLGFSLFFYAYGGVGFLLIMLLSIGINAAFGYLVGISDGKGWKKAALITAVVLNLGMLGWYKYAGFAVSNVNALLGLSLPVPEIVLPIGISFFTFQGMSYVLDVYMGTALPQKNPFNVALYVSLFPQLIAGPIVRYSTVADALVFRKETLADFSAGIVRFSVGLAKKVLIANSVGLLADQVYALHPADMSIATAWLGGIAYTLQIYFDFSGYSDMAIGLGRMFGFHFLENFNYPYISASITEFFRSRWHISLSHWFRDYVYIPLGGNRKGQGRQIWNLSVVWVLTGIWHGANWTFIFWGVYYLVILILEKTLLKTPLEKLWRPLRHVYVMVLVTIGFVVFRSDTLSYGLQMVGAMFGAGSGALADHRAQLLFYTHGIELAVAALACLPVKGFLEGKLRGSGKVPAAAGGYLQAAYAMLLLLLSTVYLISSSFNPFIYFQF